MLGDSLQIGFGKMTSADSSFPRVLVISGYTFNDASGGSITMSNLFRGWPQESLAIIDADAGAHNTEVCRNRFKLARSGQMQEDGKSPLKKSVKASLRQVGHRVAHLLGVANGVLPIRRSAELESFANTFSPQVIYTQASQLSYLNLALYLAKATQAPLVYHIMDDFPETVYRNGLASWVVRRYFLSKLSVMMRTARVCMGISVGMCEAYKRRYGREFLPFNNPIDVGKWQSGDGRVRSKSGLQLVYAGRVGVGARRTLANVIHAVRDLSKEGVRFHIFTQDHREVSDVVNGLAAASMVEVSPAPKLVDDLVKTLGAADLLVLPIDFDELSVRFLRYSMPTKIPAYMASGTPCLMIGPNDVFAVQHAKTTGWAHVLDSGSVEAIKTELAALSIDPDRRHGRAAMAKQLASHEFDGAVVRERFRACMASAAGPDSYRLL